ncbi:MAG: peptide deformylase [Treponema sp.]|jgi:peptide deformylase|nr:peptide deformylase [Treponema sp.]
MEIVQLGSETLRQKSETVTEITEGVKKLVSDMFSVMIAANGVGLAAPQVGVLKRLFIVRVDDGIRRTFINPQILETSEETEPSEEGCLSIRGVWYTITRPKRVKIQALDENGKPFTLDAEGPLGRAIQHENDHLNGILYIDYADADFRQKTIEQFQRRAARREEKLAIKKAKSARIAAKNANKEGR